MLSQPQAKPAAASRLNAAHDVSTLLFRVGVGMWKTIILGALAAMVAGGMWLLVALFKAVK